MKEKIEILKKNLIERAKKTHDRYEYLDVEVVEGKPSMEWFYVYKCPIHGMAKQKVNIHLQTIGCRQCGFDERKRKLREKFKKDTNTFINEAENVHGKKYDYSKVQYINNKTNIEIICHEIDETGEEHGSFFQKPSNHLNGEGCPLCGKTHGMTTERFIKKANLIHNNKYNYEKTVYKKTHEPVIIICPKHGEFIQKPNDHLSGCGCSKCNISRMEREVMDVLDKEHITYEWQKNFPWLKYKLRGIMKLDFYLPNYNIAIECQGIQHYKVIEYFHGKEKLEIIQKRDKVKKELCEKNGVGVFYINYDECAKEKLKEIIDNVRNKQNT